MDVVQDGPNRTQNRATEQIAFDPDALFENVPDTDFSLPANQQWIAGIIDEWEARPIEDVPLQIAGEFLVSGATGAWL
jgi:RHH-type proline utilization regulon transcriptional repressor/proline dehydrogenase/delta 1-pyrroline-5-carboxylate dehydrogenase